MKILFLVSIICPGSTDLDDDSQHSFIENIPKKLQEQVPRLITSNVTIEINQAETLELDCQFNGQLHDMMIIWKSKGINDKTTKVYSMGLLKVFYERNFTLESLGEGSGLKLIIPNIEISDSGDYQCFLNTPGGEMAVQKVIVHCYTSTCTNSSPVLRSLSFNFLMTIRVLTMFIHKY